MTDLELRTVDPDADEGRRWLTAVLQSFGDGAPDDDLLARWRRHAATDGATLTGAWPQDGEPVATYASWAQTIGLGGSTLDLHMISDVSVSPTHRRRGLLRRMITDDLAGAVARGLPLAALTASEGSIYGRFGFGPATRQRRVEIDPRRFTPRRPLPDDTGSLELVPAADAWPAITTVFAAHLARQRGAVARPAGYEPMLTGAWNHHDRGPDRHLRVLLHRDAAGEPDGYAVFRSPDVEGPRVLDVRDLLADDPVVGLRLWTLLAGMDLVERVECAVVPIEPVLEQALADPRAVRTTGVRDHLWLRVLDVPTALGARDWGEDGTVLLACRDPLGYAEGTWRVTVDDGRAHVEATDAEPQVVLDADTLGTLLLGDVAVATLHRAGRIEVAPGGGLDAVRTLGRLADLAVAPYCSTSF